MAKQNMKIHGWDLSLNHAGLVELDEAGKLTWWAFVTDKVGQAKHKNSILIKSDPKLVDRQLKQHRRLIAWRNAIDQILLDRAPTHIGIEDYALMAQSNSSYQYGELGGVARLAAAKVGLMRLHDPMSVKMFTAHNGLSTGDEIADAAEKRWPETFAAWGDCHREIRLDMAAAYSIAKMVFAEIQIKSGNLRLAELHPKEIQVFNRVTKAYPTNLLDRDWTT